MTAPTLPTDPESLAGRRVLVVEDDYFVAKEMAAVLREHGATVLGPVPDVRRGRALLSQDEPDCALLDVNLKGQFVFELAEELLDRGVPPIFTTGYDASFLPPRLREAPCLHKPVDMFELVRIIREETAMGRPASALSD
jgi:DNA-binding response OmpR family regulator